MNKLAVIVLLVGLAACSKKKTEEGREPVQTATPSSVVGSAAPAAPAPAPAMGRGEAGSAATGSAAAPASVGCATASSLVCGADQSDGCTGGLTAVHVCVAKDAKAGAPCAQGSALACPSGQTDACLHDPPQATNHVCVIAAKSTP